MWDGIGWDQDQLVQLHGVSTLLSVSSFPSLPVRRFGPLRRVGPLRPLLPLGAVGALPKEELMVHLCMHSFNFLLLEQIQLAGATGSRFVLSFFHARKHILSSFIYIYIFIFIYIYVSNKMTLSYKVGSCSLATSLDWETI